MGVPKPKSYQMGGCILINLVVRDKERLRTTSQAKVFLFGSSGTLSPSTGGNWKSCGYSTCRSLCNRGIIKQAKQGQKYKAVQANLVLSV